MTILIANLGTSDLSLCPKGETYYLPIGFDRNEPNLEEPPAGSETAEIWENRDYLICEHFCRPFGVEVTIDRNGKRKFSFRDFTERLWQEYKLNPDQWHDRIRPGRIWGVVKAAKEQFGVTQVYVFVTDQPHEGDTIYTLHILQQWFAKEEPELKLEPVLIPVEIKAYEQDKLFDYYYQFFNTISHQLNQAGEAASEVLISTKGGTGQMQTALRMQAMASMVRFQANLEPQMSVATVLAGEPSRCTAGVYWQYAKSQKYQTVKLLLSTRWDFDGAEQILRDWQRFLKRLVEQDLADQEVIAGNRELERIITALQVAKHCLNLDYHSAKRLFQRDNHVLQSTQVRQLLLNDGYSKVLSLYTQCRILWNLDQIANFLPRMASFCEAVMHQMMSQFAGIEGRVVDSRWKEVSQSEIDKNFGIDLWNKFLKLEGKKKQNIWFDKDSESYKASIWQRYSKRNFAQALVDYQNNSILSRNWKNLLFDIEQLDYWADKRNLLIHSAEGISRDEMTRLYQDIQNNDSELSQQKYKNNSNENKAVNPQEILIVMERLCRNPLLGLKDCEQYIGTEASYYLYSEIREIVLQQLI